MERQRWEESERRRAEERRAEKRKSEKKEDAGARKSRKLRNSAFFQWFVAPGGRKVGSLKRRVWSHVVRWEMKSCTPLWREDARSTFPSQNAQNTPTSDHFWKLWCRKSVRRCGAKHIWKSKVWKTDGFRALLEVEMSKKCTPLWREAHFKVKMYKTRQHRNTFGSWDVQKMYAVVARSTFPSQNVKNTTCSDHFWRLRCRFAWPVQGLVHLVKSEQNVKVFQDFRKRWQAWDIWRGSAKMHFHDRRSTRDMFIRDVRRSGRWFPERGCILEDQIFSFGKMILCDRCSTSYDLASPFRGRRHTSDTWTGKIAKLIGTLVEAVSSALNFPLLKEVSQNCFLFDVVKFKSWRSLAELLPFWCCQVQKLTKSRRIASFLMLSSSKVDEVSQNCFLFDVIKFKSWRSLAELLPVWCCQVQKLTKSRRIASFLMLSSSKVDEVSQNCFLFDVVKFKSWRSLAELLPFWCCQVQKLTKSRRIASFLMLSSSKVDEVSQNCFLFDVVKFKSWRSLAELLPFWCCQVQKLTKSRRIASFLMLSSSKVDEVSQNCFLFDVVKFKSWRSLAELLPFWCCQVQKLTKSRRIASFLMLSSSKVDEVSQNCFLFDVIKFKSWRSLAELLPFWCCQVQKLTKSRRIASFLTLSSSKVDEVSQNCFLFDVVKFKSWRSLAELLPFWRCQVQKLTKSRRIASFSNLQMDGWIDR